MIYKFKLERSKESEFTEYIIKNNGGCGSRLHKDSSGDFIAYAKWPNEETWLKSSMDSPYAKLLLIEMKACYKTDSKPEVLFKLNQVYDLLVE